MRVVVLCCMFLFVFSSLLVNAKAEGPRYSVTPLRSLFQATVAYHEAHSINDEGVAAGIDRPSDFSSPSSATIWNSIGDPTPAPALPASMAFDASSSDFRIKITDEGALAARVRVAPYKLAGAYRTAGGEWEFSIHASKSFRFQDVSKEGGTLIGTLRDTEISGVERAQIWEAGAFSSVPGISNTIASRGGSIASDGTLGVNLNSPGSVWDGFRVAPSGIITEIDSSLVGDPVLELNSHGQSIASDGSYGGYFYAHSDGTSRRLTWTGNASPTEIGALNDAGIVVGTSKVFNSVTNAFIANARNPVTVDLNTRIDSSVGWRLLSAKDINNRGQIIGYGSFDHDNNPQTPMVRSAYRLDPIRSPGDTNYDDVVDFTDLLTLAQHYGESGNGNVFYETGDFDYNWVVDFDDLLTLAQHYSTPDVFESDWVLAHSLVPEPVSILGLAALVGFARSRRA